MSAASAVARARIVNHNINVQEDKEVKTPKVLKAGERLHFSSRDGRFRIEFPEAWPFTKPHSSNGAQFQKSIGSRFYKADKLWRSKKLILVNGKEAKFNCFMRNLGGPFRSLEYGGEINPRGK